MCDMFYTTPDVTGVSCEKFRWVTTWACSRACPEMVLRLDAVDNQFFWLCFGENKDLQVVVTVRYNVRHTPVSIFLTCYTHSGQENTVSSLRQCLLHWLHDTPRDQSLGLPQLTDFIVDNKYKFCIHVSQIDYVLLWTPGVFYFQYTFHWLFAANLVVQWRAKTALVICKFLLAVMMLCNVHEVITCMLVSCKAWLCAQPSFPQGCEYVVHPSLTAWHHVRSMAAHTWVMWCNTWVHNHRTMHVL